MLKIKPPGYKFCPLCGTKLKIKTEESKTRRHCPSCGWTFYPHVGTAAAAIIKKGSKILLVKRARDPYKNTWMFPAGFVDFGEHPKEALVREVGEETGLDVKSAKLLDVLQVDDDPRNPGHFVFFYIVQVGKGEIKTDKKENKDIGWFDLTKLPKIGWKSHKKIINRLV